MEMSGENRTFGRGRRFAIGVNVFVMALVASGLSIGVVHLAFRPDARARLDLTEEKAFSLSDKSRDVVEVLSQDVRVVSLFRGVDYDGNAFIPGFGYVIAEIAQRTHDVLEEYRFASNGRVEIEMLDPNQPRDLARITEVVNQYQLGLNKVLVICGQRRKVLSLDDLARVDRGSFTGAVAQPPRVVHFNGEQAITSAILELSETQAPVLYFLAGHGERDPSDVPDDPRSLAFFVKALIDDNFEIKQLSLGGEREVPSDATVLVILAPQREIPTGEIAVIRQYLERGGRLFLCVDPRTPKAYWHDEILLGMYGMFLVKGVVCEEQGVNADKTELYLDTYGEAAPVSYHRERKLTTLFHEAGALATKEPMPPGVDVDHLVWTSREAWLDKDTAAVPGSERIRDIGEETGARVLGMAAQGGRLAPDSRICVFSDSDFLSTLRLQQGPGNQDLAVNCVEWLAGRESLISIAPKIFQDRHIDLSQEEYDQIFLYIVVVMPLGAVLLGLVVWWMRRS